MAAIDAALPTLSPLLSELRSLPYFRLYSVDMMASCEYLPQELFECYTESCEIYPADDADVPPGIRASDYDEHDFELDGWARWDMPSEDYYDTLLFPEDYTGYDGSDVWKFIHGRIGFHGGDMTEDEYDADDWKADFNKVCHYSVQTVTIVKCRVCHVVWDLIFDGGRVMGSVAVKKCTSELPPHALPADPAAPAPPIFDRMSGVRSRPECVRGSAVAWRCPHFCRCPASLEPDGTEDWDGHRGGGGTWSTIPSSFAI